MIIKKCTAVFFYFFCVLLVGALGAKFSFSGKITKTSEALSAIVKVIPGLDAAEPERLYAKLPFGIPDPNEKYRQQRDAIRDAIKKKQQDAIKKQQQRDAIKKKQQDAIKMKQQQSKTQQTVSQLPAFKNLKLNSFIAEGEYYTATLGSKKRSLTIFSNGKDSSGNDIWNAALLPADSDFTFTKLFKEASANAILSNIKIENAVVIVASADNAVKVSDFPSPVQTRLEKLTTIKTDTELNLKAGINMFADLNIGSSGKALKSLHHTFGGAQKILLSGQFGAQAIENLVNGTASTAKSLSDLKLKAVFPDFHPGNNKHVSVDGLTVNIAADKSGHITVGAEAKATINMIQHDMTVKLGKKDDVELSLTGDFSLSDLGIKNVPGLEGVKLTNPFFSSSAIGGKLTVKVIGLNEAPVLFFETNKPAGWNFAALQDNLSLATLIPKLKGTVIEKVKLSKAVLIVSKPGFKGTVGDLPKKVREWLKEPLPNDDMSLLLASGLNVGGTFVPGDAGGNVGKVLKELGAPDQIVLFGGVANIFNKSKKPSLRISGDFPKLTMPKMGFFKIPQPKNQPSFFIEYLNDQPAIGVEVSETLPIKDGDRTVDFESTLSFTVGTGGAAIAMTATSVNDWADPFGLKGLTLKKGTSLEVAGSAVGPQVSFKGIARIGEKDVTLGGTLASAGAALSGSIDSLSLMDIATFAAEIAMSSGNTLDITGLPVAELREVELAFASPGISIPEFGISNGGIRMKGDLYFIDPKKSLASVDVNFDATGFEINAELNEITLGPLKLKDNNLHLLAKTSELPSFAITSESKILGVATKVHLEVGARGFDVRSDQEFGDFFSFGFEASTGDTIDWDTMDFSKVDMRFSSSIKSDPGKWIRDQGAKAVEKAFDGLLKGVKKAKEVLAAAQKKVDGLEDDIEKQRKIVKRERQSTVDTLKNAKAEVTRLQGKIDGYDKKIKTYNGQIKECKQKKRVLSYVSASGGGCKEKSKYWPHACKKWYPIKKKNHYKNVDDWYARGICKTNNLKPINKKLWAIAKKKGFVTAKAAAEKTVDMLIDGIESIPVDLDPRVAAVIVAKETAKLTLAAAQTVLDGIGDATKFLAAGVSAVGKSDVFVLEKSTIRGSLKGGLNGEPVVLDINYRLLGKSYHSRFAFSLTDQEFNARQFATIALAAATKTIIEAGEKMKIVPNELLDRVSALYLERKAEAESLAQKAVDDNGQIVTDTELAKSGVGRAIQVATNTRQNKSEAIRKGMIAKLVNEREINEFNQRKVNLKTLIATPIASNSKVSKTTWIRKLRDEQKMIAKNEKSIMKKMRERTTRQQQDAIKQQQDAIRKRQQLEGKRQQELEAQATRHQLEAKRKQIQDAIKKQQKRVAILKMQHNFIMKQQNAIMKQRHNNR